jgi:Protein of unknown function (DUF2934)
MKTPAIAKKSNRKTTPLSRSEATAPQDQPSPQFEPTAASVAQRAYRTFQDNGETDGQDVEDWLTAEAELIAEHTGSNR